MQDRPTAPELLAAVRDFLNREVIPVSDNHRLKFRAMIAANVLSIVERELAGEEERLREEWNRLATLDNLTSKSEMPTTLDELRTAIQTQRRELCARIQTGEADAGPWRIKVLAYAKSDVREKLLVSNPRFLAKVEGS